MVRSVGGFVDFERAFHQGLGLVQAVGDSVQLGQVVEADGDVGVVGSVCGFVDFERAFHQGLGLVQAVGGFVQLCQIVERDGQ